MITDTHLSPCGRAVTPGYIAKLQSWPDENKVAAWTIQHKNVLNELLQGRFTANPQYVPAKRQSANDWMIGEMGRRGLATSSVVWVFLSMPPAKDAPIWGACSLGPDQKLLHLSIPKKRMLISFHWPWANEFLHSYPRFYLASNERERQKSEDCIFQVPPAADCQKSWQKLFDLNVIHEQEFTWSGPPPSNEDAFRLQATVPYLLRNDLIDVQDNW
jgi:hypothetical protein